MARRDETIECSNCGTENDDDSKYCKKCGSDMKKRRYSRDDDPMDRIEELETKLDRIIEYIEEDDDENEDEKEKARSRSIRRSSRGTEDRKRNRKRGGGFFG